MFRSQPWAEAFIRAAGFAGNGGGANGEAVAVAEDALEYLRVFCRAALLLPGDLSGRNDAYRIDRSIQAALAREPVAEQAATEQKAVTLAERFVQLMIRKGCFKHYKRIIREIEKIINKQKGIEEVIVEAAAEPEEKLLTAIKENARHMTAAKEVKLTVRLIPDLIGGLRLRWGSRVFDGSVQYKLRKLAGAIG